MADLSSRTSSSSLGEGFGQEEPITVRIRNILAEYPVTNLIKELLQNADDARATRVKLIIDKRWHPTSTLIEPKLAALQGPALLAHNNAPFTESDFANIRRLGASKKRGDPGVTGRFGIGFNSVYHVTDVPSFISGTQLAFLDPHELIWQSRGIKFDVSSTVSDTCQTLFASYPDQFAGYQLNGLEDHTRSTQSDTPLVDGTAVNGTLFRLPLRTPASRAAFPEISEEDTVSDVTWSTDDLERLFAKFRQEALLILLFLRSLEQIDFLIWHEDQIEPQQLFTVALRDLSESDRSLRRVIHDPEQPLRRYSLNVMLAESDHRHLNSSADHVTSATYRVVTCSQSLTADEARDIGLSDKELRKLIPWGGVATRLKTDAKTDAPSRDQSHVFCSLPVTVSGLPVHLNGCFELSASRTALSWHEYERKDRWNRHVLTVLSRAYVHLLHDCQPLLTTAEYYALFPNTNHVLHDWERYFCTQLALILHAEHVIRFKDEWIAPNKAIWPGPHIQLGDALRTWLMDSYPLVETPEHVMTLFVSETELQSLILTPVTLITWLTSREDLLRALRTNSAVYNQLWQFIFTLSEEETAKVYDVPLLFTESGTLVRMSGGTSSQKYYAIRGARLRQIFAEIRDSLIDVTLFSETVLSKLMETRFMNAQNIDLVSQLDTHVTLLLSPVQNDCKVIARDAKAFPSNDWLRLVWQYLAAENCDLSAFNHVPLIPVDGSGLVPVQYSSHVLNISARDSDVVPVHVLQRLQCHVLDADLQREITQSRVTLCSSMPEHVMQLLTALHGTQLGGQVTALSSEHKRDLRRYFVRTVQQWHVTSREHVTLKQLQIFELVGSKNSNRFVSLAQYKSRAPVQCHVLDISLPLIACTKDETAFFDSIGVPQISTMDLFRAHLFIDHMFQTLTLDQQRELLQTLFKTSTLKHCDAAFLALVRQYPCITCQDGKLRALTQVYDPENKSIADLLALSRDYCPDLVPLPEAYWQERGVFLAGMRLIGFCTVLRASDLHALLLTLQYVVSNILASVLDDHVLVSLTSIFRHMPEQMAVSLANKLFRYVVSHFSELQAQGPLDFLRHVPWLPLYRPISHVIPPFSELQDDTCLVSPLSSQPRARQSLVSAVLPLANVDLPSRDHPLVQYLEWHLPISVSCLVQQLKAVAKLFLALPSKPSAQYLQELEHVIHEIYGHLDEQLAISPDLAEVLQRNVSGTDHVIWTGQQFVAPGQVALKTELQIKPWAMKVPKFAAQFKHVTQHVGFMKQFGAEHYVRILTDLHAQYGGAPLTAKHLRQVLKIVKYLAQEILQRGADHVPLDHVPVPTDQGVLKSARTVIYRSRDTVLGSVALSHDLVHAEIAPEYCRALGIAPMDKLLLQDCIRPFGQHQDLVHRLRNVLIDYPPSSLIAEMLQNADDAGATQFRVVYDAEQYPTNQLALPLHALLETPALVFMNDAPFSATDLQALIQISNGSKQQSATKIGRYGLGFNAVYNVTDTPMLLTGDKLVVFDPQLEYLRGWSSDKEPGVCISYTAPNNMLNADLLAPFRHYGVDPTRPYHGTILRLPLRTKKSKVSATVCTEEHVLELLRKFAALGTAPMVFLQHVEQVRVLSRDKIGETVHVQHAVEVDSKSNSPPHSRAVLEQFVQARDSSDHVTGMLAHRLTIHSTYSGLSSHHHVTEHQEWQVCHQCATSSPEFDTEKLLIGGVAHCLSDLDKSRAGRLFSFLPLPIAMPLPMFVNGYFQLSSARTSLTEGTWNELLRDGPIFECYWWMMMNLRKDSPAAYWAILPQTVHDSKDYWTPLVTRVYQQLAREPSLFVIESHRLVPPRDAIYYADLARDRGLDETLRNYLLHVLHVPLVACPRHVIEEFKRVNVPIDSLSPQVLRKFIKQHVISLEYSTEALQLLEYCAGDIKSATATELLGLPLLPVKSRALVRFSATSPCILVRYPTEYELFPPSLHVKLVDIDALPRNLVQISSVDMGIVPLSLEVLLDHVDSILPLDYYRQHVIINPAPSVLQWIYHFWQWIKRQCVTWSDSVNQIDDSPAPLIDTLCAQLADWPVVPTVSGQLVAPNTPLFYQGSVSPEQFELTLARRLGCQFVDTQRYHVPVEFTERLYRPNMINILRYTLRSPETFAKFSELSPMDRDRALALIAQFSDAEIDLYCTLIRQLPLYPLVHELPQRLTDLALLAAANYSRELMAPELWLQTRDTLNTCFYTAVIVPLRASAVALQRDQSVPPVPLNTAVPFIRAQYPRLYARLGVRTVSSAEYLTNHVLPHLSELDDPNMVMQYIAEHWLQLRSFVPLVNSLRSLAFVAHGTGTAVCARDLHHPEHVIYRVLYQDEPEQFPAAPYTSVTWLAVLSDLGLHVMPSTDDVIKAARILAEKLSYDHSDPQLLQSLRLFWSFVLDEKLLQSLPQLSSLKLVVAQWDHREWMSESGPSTNHVRVVVPLKHIGFDIERELIWTQQPIIDSEVFGSDLVNELFAQHRTADNHVTPLDMTTVYAHLETVLQRVRERSRDQRVCGNVFVQEHVVRQYELEKTFRELWRFMNSEIESLDDEFIAQLQRLPWLLITQQSRSYLVAPKNIFADVSSRLTPLWFALPNLYTTHELAVRVTRGQEPSASDARAALRELHESRVRIVQQSLEGDTAHVTSDVVLELMRLAAKMNSDELMQSQSDLPVLNEHHVLVPASHVFIRDRHVSHFQIESAVQFLHPEVSRDLGLALGAQLFSKIIEERVVSHVTVESLQHVDDELLQSHRELQEMMARLRSPIFADVLVLILRAQNPNLSELTITHSVNQLKKLRAVYCSSQGLTTHLIDRRNNSVLSQPRGNTIMLLQQEQLFVANKPRFIRWSDLLAQQLNKFFNFILTDLLSLSAVLACDEKDMIACCLAVESSSTN